MATYVMTDIHGEYDKLMKMLNKIKFSSADNLLILGDNVDRGPKNMAVLEFIHNTPNVESLLGNHELMMLNTLRYTSYPSMEVGNWFRNGGNVTYAELREYINQYGEQKAYAILKDCSNWKFYKQLTVNGKKFLGIHAGYWMSSVERYRSVYLGEPERLLQETSDIEKVWLRDEFYSYAGIPEVTTLFGHTPTKHLHGELKIWHDPVYEDKINLDCGAAYGGLLACLRLDDMQEFYV